MNRLSCRRSSPRRRSRVAFCCSPATGAAAAGEYDRPRQDHGARRPQQGQDLCRCDPGNLRGCWLPGRPDRRAPPMSILSTAGPAVIPPLGPPLSPYRCVHTADCGPSQRVGAQQQAHKERAATLGSARLLQACSSSPGRMRWCARWRTGWPWSPTSPGHTRSACRPSTITTARSTRPITWAARHPSPLPQCMLTCADAKLHGTHVYIIIYIPRSTFLVECVVILSPCYVCL